MSKSHDTVSLADICHELRDTILQLHIGRTLSTDVASAAMRLVDACHKTLLHAYMEYRNSGTDVALFASRIESIVKNVDVADDADIDWEMCRRKLNLLSKSGHIDEETYRSIMKLWARKSEQLAAAFDAFGAMRTTSPSSSIPWCLYT